MIRLSALLIIISFSISCGKDLVNPDDTNIGYSPVHTFEWVLSEVPDPAQLSGIDYVDIDGFEASAETVAQLQAQGSLVIGYISVGSLEDWRSDVSNFPDVIIGRAYDGWDGERWLDIGNLDVIKAPLEARLNMLSAKGFDAVEPDNLDGYEANTGFDISAQETLEFLNWLVQAAHDRGLLIGQKNIPEFTSDLYQSYDFVLTEDAFVQGWEADVSAYRSIDKPVFMVEYSDEDGDWNEACQRAEELDYTFLLKNRELDLWSVDCDGSN
jgi:endo-alpha-1,4-polygalactosaminidase (GH114 family)